MGTLRGGLITKRPLCLSHDGKMFFAPCGNDVRIYSAISGELLAILRGHTAAVTAVAQDPSSVHQLYSSGRDGTLRLWNYETGALLRTYDTQGPTESLVVSRQLNIAYLSLQHGQAGRVTAMQLPSGEVLPGRLKMRGPSRLFVSPSGMHVATIDRNSLFVWGCGSDMQRKPFNFHHTRLYTCAAMDARDAVLAAGDVSGRILIWHNFADAVRAAAAGANPQPRACTTVHWHAHPVGSLAFTLDGTYLLSGGQEGVLVQWQLDNGKRTYLPRLDGPLNGITPSPADAARILVSQSDNAVRLVNLGSLAVECSVMGLRPPPPRLPQGGAAAAAVLQPGSGHLVLPCDNALLQFFDAVRDSHVGKLQVAPRNYVSLTDAATVQGLYGPPAQPQVTQLCFGAASNCLATVDIRPGAGPGAEVESTLRFWDRAPPGPAGTPPYILNTQVDAPHRGDVTGLSYHPSEDMVASTSDDGEFKLWVRMPGKKRSAAEGARGAGDGGSWRCASVGSYRGQPLGACAFSPDGSLLAVAAGRAGGVTVWRPHTNTLVARLGAPLAVPAAEAAAATCEAAAVAPAGAEEAAAAPSATANSGAAAAVAAAARAALGGVCRLAFLSSSPHLVGTTDGPNAAIIVWDLLTASVAWSLPLWTNALAVDPLHALFAVGMPAGGGGRPGQVLVFGVERPWPLHACPVPGTSPAALLFVPQDTGLGAASSGASPPGMSPLLIVTDDRKFALATAAGAEAAGAASGRPAAAGVGQGDAAGRASALEATFGRTERPVAAGAGAAAGAQEAAATKGAVALLFDAPSHILPPPSNLCPMLLELLVGEHAEDEV